MKKGRLRKNSARIPRIPRAIPAELHFRLSFPKRKPLQFLLSEAVFCFSFLLRCLAGGSAFAFALVFSAARAFFAALLSAARADVFAVLLFALQIACLALAIMAGIFGFHILVFC